MTHGAGFQKILRFAKIPRDTVVFMKVTGDKKFNLWSGRQAKRQAKKGAPVISVTVKKMGAVHSRIEGLALERTAQNPYIAAGRSVDRTGRDTSFEQSQIKISFPE
jgi:hypothetical protein